MKLVRTLSLLLLLAFGSRQLCAQLIADFETLVDGPDEVYNGSDGTTGFVSGGVSLDVEFQDFGDFTAWSGFSISSVMEPDNGGLPNQYAARPGSGAENSLAYAVTFTGSPSVLKLTEATAGQPVLGMSVTNTSYAYYSMLEGDDFAKAFGGETGDDPDYFLLTIHGYLDGDLLADSVDFYLADYRFENNDLDYIVSDWNFIDLSGLGAVDSLSFQLSSTDNSAFGMNTPAYFCLDNVVTSSPNALADVEAMPEVELYPNPVVDRVLITAAEQLTGSYRLLDQRGVSVAEGRVGPFIDLSRVPAGVYFLLLESNDGWISRKLIRQ